MRRVLTCALDTVAHWLALFICAKVGHEADWPLAVACGYTKGPVCARCGAEL